MKRGQHFEYHSPFGVEAWDADGENTGGFGTEPTGVMYDLRVNTLTTVGAELTGRLDCPHYPRGSGDYWYICSGSEAECERVLMAIAKNGGKWWPLPFTEGEE